MPNNFFKKILEYRMHGFVSAIILLSIVLFSAYQVNVKAMGLKVFAGIISAQLPMSLCTQYQYDICEACSQCGCGEWDEDSISPIFGAVSNSAQYACKMSSYQPQGTAGMEPGSIVFGLCSSEELSAWDPLTCNIWSTY